jgi:hypothetical protein
MSDDFVVQGPLAHFHHTVQAHVPFPRLPMMPQLTARAMLWETAHYTIIKST